MTDPVDVSNQEDEDQFEADAAEIEEEEESPVSETDRALEKAYEAGKLRVVQDRNDFFLSHVVDFLRVRQWGNVRPPYQRRLRWDQQKKSRLIESFIMNVPVPAVFLFENELGKYEVMDGQQRLSSIDEYFAGGFALKGLKIWPGLNDKTFAQLPPLIRRALERSKVSAITLMTDTQGSTASRLDLRAQVFERLNTGGEKLNQQELRNCLYSGPFNDLLVKLSSDPKFTAAWDIPNHTENTLSDGTIDERLKSNKLYATMSDCQIVLRFFAFRSDTLAGSTKKLLDDCMRENRNASAELLGELERDYRDALDLAIDVFGAEAFRLPPTEKKNRRSHSRPLYDAQMIALWRNLHRREELVAARAKIRAAVDAVCVPTSDLYSTIVGRPNTAKAISRRINSIQQIVEGAL